MKKSIKSLLALTLALSFTLSACGTKATVSETKATDKPAGEVATEKPVESGEPTTIVVWSENRHDSVYVQGKIDEFNKTNTQNIKIDYIIQTDNFVNMVLMAASSNQSPDIINAALIPENMKIYDEADFPLPLNDLMTPEFKTRTNADNAMYTNLNVFDSKVYLIPTCARSGSRLIYNKELFEKAGIKESPKTLAELVSDAKAITSIGNGVSYGIAAPGLSSPFPRMLGAIGEASGIYPYDFVNGKYDFSKYKPLIEASNQMFNDGSMLPGSVTMKVDPMRVQFSEGNIGFYANASQEVGVLTNQFPAKMEWGAAELPTVDGEVKGALSMLPTMGWMISKQTKNADKAFQVVDFFSSEDFLVGYVEAGLGLAFSPVISDKVDESKLGRLADFALLDYESIYPAYPQVTPEGKNFNETLWDLCQPTSVDIDKALADLTKSYNDALDKEVKMGKVKRLIIKDYNSLKPMDGTFEYLSE